MSGHKSKPSFTFVSFFDSQKDKPLFIEKDPPSYYAANKSEKARNSNDFGANGSLSGGGGIKAYQVHALIPIVTWIGFSMTVILFNKYILTELDFHYPIFLTTCHLTFQTLASRIFYKYTNLVDGAKELEASGKMNNQVWLRNIVPIGFLFSLSLVLSNWVYLRLSVSFIQMIKAVTPVVVLLLSFTFGLKQPSQKLFYIVCLISLGVGIASYGEADFDMAGFIVQSIAIVVESSRLTLIQILLQGIGMDPITSLYYYAPVCLFFNLLILFPLEGSAPFYAVFTTVGTTTLLFNASITLGLNLASVWLIGKASGLVLTLAGVVKDVLLITGSFVFLGSTITSLQIFGYGIALVGFVLFRTQG